jgi:hypothetical protein
MFSALLGQIMGGGLGPFPAGWGYYKQAPLTAQGSEAGTISVSNGSATVTGSGTAFTDWGPGDRILLPDTNWYTISAVASATSLTITENYPGSNASGESYSLRLTNYQVRLMVGESSGSSGADVHCEGKCNADFSDLRFTAADGATQFDHWIESVSGTTPNQTATVTIEGNQIETADTYLRMYYGNSSAFAVSNGPNTFIQFDDFEWGNDTDDINTSGGSVTWTTNNGVADIDTAKYYSGSRSARFPGRASTGVSYYFTCIGWDVAISVRFYKENAVTNGPNIYHESGGKFAQIYVDSGENLQYYDGSSHDTGVNVSADTWQHLELRNFDYSAGTFDIYLNGALAKSGATMGSQTALPDKVQVANFTTSSTAYEVWYDDVIVRKYLEPEPEFGAWGSEQSV